MRQAWVLVGAVLLLAIGFAGGSLASGSDSNSSTTTATVHCVIGPGTAPCELSEAAALKRACHKNVGDVKLTTIIEDLYRSTSSRTTNTYPC